MCPRRGSLRFRFVELIGYTQPVGLIQDRAAMTRIVLSVVFSLHALIHLMGFAKGFGLASFDQLKVPISRPMGALWLAASILIFAATLLQFVAPRWFWLLGAIAVVVSQLVIVSSWSDARFGSIANLLLLAATVYGAFARGPFGLRAEYEGLVRQSMASVSSSAPPTVITEADLASLPIHVQRYMRAAGVVGAPRAMGFRSRMKGRIRGSATAPWMPFVAEQHSFFGPPRRYFWMEATRAGLLIDGLHAYGESGASMRIRLLSMLPVVSLRSAELTATETVTVLNDMCIMAPWSLLDPAIRWREVDDRTVEATYTNGPHTIRAALVFDDAGRLANFWSDDRPSLGEDGKTLQRQRWSTPISDYRAMGPYRLAARGEARYAAPSGEYAYIEFEGIEVSALPDREAR